MDIKKIHLPIILILVTKAVSAAVAIEDITNPINCVLCRILVLLWAVSAAIATVVIVIAGIKWIGSAEDPGMRAQAKSTIIHALIGLILVSIALELVGWVTTGTGLEIDPTNFGGDCETFCTT